MFPIFPDIHAQLQTGHEIFSVAYIHELNVCLSHPFNLLFMRKFINKTLKQFESEGSEPDNRFSLFFRGENYIYFDGEKLTE